MLTLTIGMTCKFTFTFGSFPAALIRTHMQA